MPRGLRFALVVLAMLAAGIGVCLLILNLLVGSFMGAIGTSLRGGAGGAVADQPVRIAFLQHEGFDPAAPGAALVLHPLATGGATLAITDPRVLSQAAPRAHYTDDPVRELGLVLLSILFLSPPANGTSAPFASLFMDGRDVATFTCFRLHCSAPEAARDMAGLIAAGLPATLEFETVTGLPDARVLEAAILADPRLLLVAGAESQPSQAARFDGYVAVRLPTVFAPVEDPPSLDPAPIEAAAEAALRDAFGTAGLEVGVEVAVEPVQSNLSWLSLQLRRGETPVTDANGYLVTSGYLPTVTPETRIWLARADLARLDAALAALPPPGQTVSPDQTALAPWVAMAQAAQGLQGPASDYTIAMELWGIEDRLSRGPFLAPEVPLSYYRIAE